MILKHLIEINPSYMINPYLDSTYDKALISFFNLTKVQSLMNSEYLSEGQMDLLLLYWRGHLHSYYMHLLFKGGSCFILGLFLLNCGIDFRYLDKSFLLERFTTDFSNYRIV